jgi:hypothetical protein
MDPAEALAIMAKDAGTKLCAASFGVLGNSAYSDELKPRQGPGLAAATPRS